MSTECDVRFHSADRLGHGSRLSYGLRLIPVNGPSGGTVDKNTSSQASMVSTGKLAFSGIKSARKRGKLYAEYIGKLVDGTAMFSE